MCSKCQIKSAVPGVALKLIVGESSGNTRSKGKDSGAVARNKRVGGTKSAVRPAIESHAAVVGNDTAVDIHLATSLRHNPAIGIAGIHTSAGSDPGIRSGKQAV